MEDKNQMTDMPPAAIPEESESMALQVYGPTMEMANFVSKHDQVTAYCHGKLKPAIDYGIIPGTSDKSLWQPGAEKLSLWFGLIPEFNEKLDILKDGDKTVISSTTTCSLRDRQGIIRGICTANCNSAEEKYADRDKWLVESKIPEGIDKNTLETKDAVNKSNGGKFKLYRVKNVSSPFSLINTLTRMSAKRAFVGAVRMATATSSIFKYAGVGEGDDDPRYNNSGSNKKPPQQQSQSKSPSDPPPPAANLSDADKDVLLKRETFYNDWKDADPDARVKKLTDLGKKARGEWKEDWGDASKFDLKKQMAWLMSFATEAGVIPPDPTVKR